MQVGERRRIAYIKDTDKVAKGSVHDRMHLDFCFLFQNAFGNIYIFSSKAATRSASGQEIWGRVWNWGQSRSPNSTELVNLTGQAGSEAERLIRSLAGWHVFTIISQHTRSYCFLLAAPDDKNGGRTARNALKGKPF